MGSPVRYFRRKGERTAEKERNVARRLTWKSLLLCTFVVAGCGREPGNMSPEVTRESVQLVHTSTPLEAELPGALEQPLALDGCCPVTLYSNSRWQPGDARWGAVHRGCTYLFAGEAEQQQFLSAPDRFGLVASGLDVVLAADKNQKTRGNRRHGVFYQNRVFLFVSEDTLDTFWHNPAHYAGPYLTEGQTYPEPAGAAATITQHLAE